MAKKRTTKSKSEPGSAVSRKRKPAAGARGAKDTTKKKYRSSTHPADSRRAPESAPVTGPQRLQKVLASAGVGSRRACEELIETGRVQVDDAIVSKLGTKVDPDKHQIYVDGQKIAIARREYYVLNKPPGIISTANDPSGRMRVIDLIKTRQRVYNVGRLDQSSEGLILVTNDGELANRLTHPRYGVAKTYHVQVQGVPDQEKLRSLVEGIYLADGKARVANVKFKRRSKSTSWLEIVLDEGRNREIRRLLARIGHKVLTLRRVAIGPLKIGELPVGAHRRLSVKELRELRAAVEGRTIKRSRPKKKSVATTAKKSTAKKSATGKSSVGKRSSTSGTKSKRPVAGKSFGKKKPAGRSSRSSAKSTKKKSPARSSRSAKPTGRKATGKPRRR